MTLNIFIKIGVFIFLPEYEIFSHITYNYRDM